MIGLGWIMEVPGLTGLLQGPGKGRGEYEPTAPKHHWSGWYAASLVARERGRTSDEAAKDAALHIERPGAALPTRRESSLDGQTVVVLGGSAGIGFETARLARAQGANVILTARNAERLQRAASEVGAQKTAAFDASDPAALEEFFQGLPAPIDQVMVTAGAPRYGPVLEMDAEEVRRALTEHMLLALSVARNAAKKIRPGGALLLMSGTGGRRIALGLGIVSAVTAAMPALTASLALEPAPVRLNLIAPRFVDT